MKPELSVVIPILNEAANLEILHQEFTQALAATGRAYELLLIDDGSTDESFAIMKRLQAGDRRVRVIRFRRNFGQTAAFAAGVDAARGDVVITADGDLQNDPGDIPGMLQRMSADGADIVCGWRKDRKDAFLSRRLPSMLANRLISWATGVRLHDYGCSLKVFRADVIKTLHLRGEMHRFLPALASGIGATIVEMPVNHRPRTRGTSKYGIGRTFRVILDLLTVKFILSYSTQPLQIFGMLGGVMALTGAGLLGYLGTLRLLHIESIMQRLPLTLLGILLLFTGVQFVTLGLLAELQARNYHELQNRPSYVVREVVESLDE
ncbi:MAG TPA: glycosyltransferase family 2 protein [Vicinamibacterales bacterium]|nr:glycosyltransferase family 2 protein [Vicinamibacterales bacterium]